MPGVKASWRRLRLFVLICLPALLLVAAGQSRLDPRKAVALLDAYQCGEFASVVSALETLDDFDALRNRLEKDAPGWIAAEGDKAASTRRLIAATVALEAARVDEWREWKLVQRGSASGAGGFLGSDTLYWKPPPKLIAWAAKLFRANSASTPSERWWTLASLAVAERAEDDEFLIGSPFEVHGNPKDEFSYVAALVERFPNEARIRLAQGIALEWRTWPAKPLGRRSPGGPKEAQAVFQSLTKDEDVGGEALLRLGHVQFRANSLGPALSSLDDAERATRDPYLVYLARFLRGQILERQKKMPEAMTAYRAALAVIPRAQSASLALAEQLFLAGQPTEAASILNGNLSADPQPIDPWRVYADADDRFWPELIARVRAEIRR